MFINNLRTKRQDKIKKELVLSLKRQTEYSRDAINYELHPQILWLTYFIQRGHSGLITSYFMYIPTWKSFHHSQNFTKFWKPTKIRVSLESFCFCYWQHHTQLGRFWQNGSWEGHTTVMNKSVNAQGRIRFKATLTTRKFKPKQLWAPTFPRKCQNYVKIISTPLNQDGGDTLEPSDSTKKF